MINVNKVESKSAGNIVPLEPGTYPARLVQVIDLGLQPQSFQGQDRVPMQNVLLTYEFVDEFMKDEKGKDDTSKPRWFSESFPLHHISAEKAKSTIRYKTLDPTGKYEGDFSQLLSIPVNVILIQNVGKGKNVGKIFNNIASISTVRLKEAVKFPELVNDAKFFDLDEPDMSVFEKLPDWVKDKITSNLNFRGSKMEGLLGRKTERPMVDLDDEIPF